MMVIQIFKKSYDTLEHMIYVIGGMIYAILIILWWLNFSKKNKDM